MMDQAARLREIATELQPERVAVPVADTRNRTRARVYAITSGKGGVGKTHIAVNLSLKIKEAGYKVLLVDADINLANTNILMGHAPSRSMADAITKGYPISDVIYAGADGLHVLPGGSGFVELVDMPDTKKDYIIRQLTSLEYKYDYLIVDTPAGIHKQVLDFVTYSSRALVVITPEPASIADTYALLKILTMQKKAVNVHVIVNQVDSLEHAKDIFRKFNLVVKKFLNLKIHFLNYIVKDNNFMKAALLQKPIVLAFPKSPGSKCLDNTMERIVTQGDIKSEEHHSSFFQRVSELSIIN